MRTRFRATREAKGVCAALSGRSCAPPMITPQARIDSHHPRGFKPNDYDLIGTYIYRRPRKTFIKGGWSRCRPTWYLFILLLGDLMYQVLLYVVCRRGNHVKQLTRTQDGLSMLSSGRFSRTILPRRSVSQNSVSQKRRVWHNCDVRTIWVWVGRFVPTLAFSYNTWCQVC